MRDSEFNFIRQLVYDRSRIHLNEDKRQLVTARLGKRLLATNTGTIGEYCELLNAPDADDELVNLIDAISTNHTAFFREMEHFEFLRQTVVPEAQADRGHAAATTFRVWSAACSSGEEPFSIAMTLAGSMPQRRWHVEGSDISTRMLERANRAIYSAEAVAPLPLALLRAHFQRGFGPQEGNYRVKRVLRARVTFHHHNLLESPLAFPEPFQVIFCRNAMIYFDRATQDELVARLTARLAPGGYLFIGHAESLAQLHHSLRPVKPAIYRKPEAP